MLVVNSIFRSIDGEICHWHQGRVTTFVRFSGCSLNCSYCDTKQAQGFDQGMHLSPKRLFFEVDTILPKTKNITITGGEPLEQDHESLIQFIGTLLMNDYLVSIETNGTRPVLREFLGSPNISYVMDYKLPNSGMTDKINMNNFYGLGPKDFVKFVVGSSDDFIMACQFMNENFLNCTFAFSLIPGLISPALLVEWMKSSTVACNAIFSYQLHKIIWPNAKEER